MGGIAGLAGRRRNGVAPSTKQALAASLKKLLKWNALDDSTVKEIVAACSVSRPTYE